MQIIGFLTTVFIGLTIINSILGGQILKNANTFSQLNNVMMFRPVNLGIMTFPVPNLSFITEGLPHLVNFQGYSFFEGNAQIIMWFLYSATAAIAFLMFLTIVGIVFYRYGSPH